MNKYQGAVTHRDILGGGAYELAPQLLNAVKQDPERFYDPRSKRQLPSTRAMPGLS